MKKVLASLLTAFVLTNGQAPPVEVATQVAPAPGTTAAASAATTSGATTAAPGTSAPVVTTAPQTTVAATTTPPAPIVPDPVPPIITPAPTMKPTLNPYCPLNAGQQSGIQPNQFNENRVCFTPNEVATDYLGRLRCDNFACCQCAQINCGFDGYPCEQIKIGDSGAVGAKSINIRGAPEMNGNSPLQNIFGGNAFATNGAKMDCAGRESCKAAIIRGELVSEAQCSGDFGCQDAKIVLNDPMTGMNFQCNGLQSCQRSDIEINDGVAELASRAPGQACNPAFSGVVKELGKIEFNGQQAGSNSIVTIRNHGCGTLLFDSFECMSLDSCPGLAVNIDGNIAFRHCDLMGVAPGNPAIQSLVAACQAGQAYGNFNPGNTLPIPGQGVPQFPPQSPSVPVIPSNPVNPTPVNPTVPVPVNPSVPSFPAPGQGFPSFGVIDPRSSSMQCDQVGMPFVGVGMANPRACAGQTITLQIANNFVLDCSLAGACNGMTLILNAGYDPTSPGQPVTRIDSLKFIQANSDVTIYINNELAASGGFVQPLRINDVRCAENNTCRNLKIIAGPGVDIMSTNYDCGQAMSCYGATVEQGGRSMPMDPRTVGYGMGGNYNPITPGGIPANPSNPGQPQPFNPWAV